MGTSLTGLVRFLLFLFVVPSAFAKPLVVLLSWDGVRHDALTFADFPSLQRVANDGLLAERLIPGWPSNTFPGHVTLATGTWVDRHGIVDNEFVDVVKGVYRYSSDANWLAAEPLWIAAERQGVKAATYFWVGSESDWHGQRQSYRIAPFDPARPESEKVDQILAWIALPEAQRPGLIMSYWRGADSIGHRKGPKHPDVIAALQEQDLQLKRILDVLDREQRWSETTLIIVSDHGMTAYNELLDPEALLAEAGIAATATGGALVHLTLADKTQLEDAMARLQSIPHLEVFTPTNLPKERRLLFPGRHGDLILVAQPPLALRDSPWYEAPAYFVLGGCCGWQQGGHGYDPQLPDMGAWLLAMGRGVGKGQRIGPVAQIDIAPTISTLLGIQPPAQAEGRPIAEIKAKTEQISERLP